MLRSNKRHHETLALFGIIAALVATGVAFAFRFNGRAQTKEGRGSRPLLDAKSRRERS